MPYHLILLSAFLLEVHIESTIGFFLKILFIYFWLRWVFIAACGLSLVAESRGYSLLRCTGFSLRWLLLLQSTGSRHMGFSSCGTRASVVVAHGLSSCGSRALECRLSSCGPGAQLLRGIWDIPGPGLEPVSPALTGGFLTTAPPGKSHYRFLHKHPGLCATRLTVAWVLI